MTEAYMGASIQRTKADDNKAHSGTLGCFFKLNYTEPPEDVLGLTCSISLKWPLDGKRPPQKETGVPRCGISQGIRPDRASHFDYCFNISSSHDLVEGAQ